jgi:hypothetical protein
MMKPTLYTYCIPYDDGAAPNPFWGQCTLVICKPRIRKVARPGDWVVGTGVTNSVGGINSVVYSMRVSTTLTMREYDAFTKARLPAKVPDWRNRDHRRRLGDSIYDFSHDPPGQRHGVHDADNMRTDLSGSNALLSDHFFYFGNNATELPTRLHAIVKSGQGHRSISNAQYIDESVDWIESLGYEPNSLEGDPQLDLFRDEESARNCATGRRRQAEEDETAEIDTC